MAPRLMRLLALCALLGSTACAGDTEGMRCESNGDCDDGQVCAALATCAGDDCPAICGRPCADTADCDSGEICAETSSTDARICQDSRTIDDF